MLDWFKKRYRVLIVCTANRTRSAYVAGYLQQVICRIRPGALRSIRITSAGTRAIRGGRVNDTVALLARRNGFSLRGHLSSPLTARSVRRADLILVMEREQKQWILERWPDADWKVFLLTEYGWRQEDDDEDAPPSDVPDPTGENADAFEAFEAVAHDMVARIVDEWMRQGRIA